MKSNTSIIVVFFFLLNMLTIVTAQQPADDAAPQREIQHVAGDLYRVFNNSHRTPFLVTPEGIILADPLNTDFASWLKAELEERYDVPVRYVIYSHHHFDHASGGDVFADTAKFIGQENMTKDLAEWKSNGDKRYGEVRAPDITFSERMTVSLGGKTVELVHSLPSHSDDSIVMIFTDERAAHAVDWINIRRLPFTQSGAPVNEWIASLKELEGLDFDTLMPGHGPTGTKADVSDYRAYLEVLLAAVSQGIEHGKSIEELQNSDMLSAYKDWESYKEFRGDNIRRTYEYLTRSK